MTKVKSAPVKPHGESQPKPLRGHLAQILGVVGGASSASARSRKQSRKVTFGGEEVATFEVAKMRSIR